MVHTNQSDRTAALTALRDSCDLGTWGVPCHHVGANNARAKQSLTTSLPRSRTLKSTARAHHWGSRTATPVFNSISSNPTVYSQPSTRGRPYNSEKCYSSGLCMLRYRSTSLTPENVVNTTNSVKTSNRARPPIDVPSSIFRYPLWALSIAMCFKAFSFGVTVMRFWVCWSHHATWPW